MWRAVFLALGISCLVLGLETLVVERVVLAAETPATASSTTGDATVKRREYVPHEAAPWMLMSAGAVVMLYSFTIPRRVRD